MWGLGMGSLLACPNHNLEMNSETNGGKQSLAEYDSARLELSNKETYEVTER